MLYRHGDVLVQKIRNLPANTKKLRHLVLAHGEVTGHSHRIKDAKSAELYEDKETKELFLNVVGTTANLIHEEHATIELGKGVYRVWRQREYTPKRIVVVRD